jgi:hypothetical protein
MKTCHCCGAQAERDVPACTACGEASWSPDASGHASEHADAPKASAHDESAKDMTATRDAESPPASEPAPNADAPRRPSARPGKRER